MNLFRYSFFRKKNKRNRTDWANLEKQTVFKMKKEAVDFKKRVTKKEYLEYNKMKIISALWLPIAFSLCYWNILFGSLISIFISTIWFFIWYKKSMRYACIFPLASVLSTVFCLLTFLVEKAISNLYGVM